jgi:hypothetical protein
LAGHSRPFLADVVVFVLFLAVPLAASPIFWDQFTTVKWYVLEALAVVWFVYELWGLDSWGWPAFVRERWRTCLLLGGLVALNSLRFGTAWAAPALLDRSSFLLLALASYWYFRRNEGWTGSPALGAGLATILVVMVGLAQVLGWQPLPFLAAGDQRSAFFGNVNQAAQFLGFAALILLAEKEEAFPPHAGAALREVLVAGSLVYLYFLSCRSVFLALSAAFVVLLAARRLTARSLVRMVGAATVVILLLIRYGPAWGGRPSLLHFFSSEILEQKALSVAMRLAVWKSTLSLIGSHPLGVGSGNFGEAFIPYQLGLDMIPGERVLFRTPHNEYLRALAEEGVLFGAFAATLLWSLLRGLYVASRMAVWRREVGAFVWAGIAFLAVEAFFQFPLGTAFGCLVGAALLGLALSGLEAGGGRTRAAPDPSSPRLWRGLGTLAAVTVLVLLGRVAASEFLFVNYNGEVAAQEASCQLNPRNLPACVTAAWLRAQAGDRREARALLVQVLQRAPYYHPAIRLLGEEAAANGDRDEGCLYLWIYDELFRERSSVHARVGALCGRVPPANLPAGIRMPYYDKFPFVQSARAVR